MSPLTPLSGRKVPCIGIVQNPPFILQWQQSQEDLTCSDWGNVSLMCLTSSSGWKCNLNYWTKNESFCRSCVFFPWDSWRWYCQERQKKSMLKQTHIKSVHQQASSYENRSMCMSRSMWCSSVNSAFVVRVLHQVVAYTRLQDSGNASCCIAHAAMQVSKQLKTHSTAHDREGAGPNHKEKQKKWKKKEG